MHFFLSEGIGYGKLTKGKFPFKDVVEGHSLDRRKLGEEGDII